MHGATSITDEAVRSSLERPIVFRVRRKARKRVARLRDLTIDVMVDFGNDAVKMVDVREGSPPEIDGYARFRLGETRVHIRSETFTGFRLTRLPVPERIVLGVDPSGDLVADVRFAG